MTEIKLNGCVLTKNKGTFINEFNKLLEKTKSQFKGQCRVVEFDDVEFIEDNV